MRTLSLLLSAGAMLSLAAGSAYAGRLMDMQGNPSTPTGTGLVTTGAGFHQMGSPYTGGQGLEGEGAAPFSKPAPGTVNMRINSFVNEFPMAVWYTGMDGSGTPAANHGNKQQGYGIYGWIRIDLGIDGQTKGGIKYGAFTEIRENNRHFRRQARPATRRPTRCMCGTPTSISAPTRWASSGPAAAIAAQTLFETGLNDNFDMGGWISFAGPDIPGNSRRCGRGLTRAASTWRRVSPT